MKIEVGEFESGLEIKSEDRVVGKILTSAKNIALAHLEKEFVDKPIQIENNIAISVF